MMTPQDIATACATAMFAADRATREFMQMELVDCKPGFAQMRMRVREEMLNGHRVCHGGLIFTLADSAFAFACNSFNALTLAGGCSIEFLKPGASEDTLTATASQVTQQGRNGIYDVEVRNAKDELIAVFRGKSVALKDKTVLPAHTS
jgi:acyl-CoA thioesterase